MTTLPAVAVAASGGRDSTALLHATWRAAGALGVRVLALHVHHGLVPQADAFAAHVQAQCKRWSRRGPKVEFRLARLVGAPASGESVEAWARRGRYGALAELARAAGCTLILLAHHRRDQAETLLLQALRGGGPAGLAAMPPRAERDGLTWARPWLDRPREAIEAYVRRHRLAYVDDPSNGDRRHARNRLRLEVWPVLCGAYADAEAQLAAAARRAEEAAALQSEIARIDLAAATSADGALDVAVWGSLSPARRANALRVWLRDRIEAPETLVRRLLDELAGARTGACWPAGSARLGLHRGRLRLEPASGVAAAREPLAAAPVAAAAGTAEEDHRALEPSLDLSRPGRHRLAGWVGDIVVERVGAGGLPVALLGAVTARMRSGGERFQLAPRSLPRSLKKQYQARGVPSWLREGPLLYASDGRLLFVPGLGVDARALAAPGERQARVRWEPPRSATRRDSPPRREVAPRCGRRVEGAGGAAAAE